MIQEYTFEGTAKYAHLQSPNKYKNYSVNLYVDDKTRRAIKATGTKNNPKEDEDGWFYTFRCNAERDPKPDVLSPEGQAITDLIGNGSKLRVRITVENFISPAHGPQVRTKLKAVVVDHLIRYVPNATETPATEKIAVPF